MTTLDLGHTLVIANPASHSGRGAQAAERVRRFFEAYASATSSFDLELTRAPLDAVEMAAHAGGMDTVIALGGDGVIHEVMNGLMALDERDRPRLGIVPMGTGNDFARTLGVTFNDPEASLRQLLGGNARTISLGLVSSDLEPHGPVAGSPGTYFMETLSFGMDAAIAIDTTDRRAGGTSTEGEALFVTSSLKVVAAGSAGWRCLASVDGEEPAELRTLMFAIQNGPTYGAGFRICPDADPCAPRLDVCHNVRKPALPHLFLLLGLARLGLHTRSRALRLRTATHASLAFPDGEPPCQVDGERLRGTRFEVSVVPDALDVVFPGA